MTKKRYFLTLGILLFFMANKSLFAQQDAHYSQYIFNGLILNPAYAGSRGTVSATAFYRNQWLGFPGAPVTQSLSIHTPAGGQKYGFGLSLSNDKIGYVSQQWVNGSYAFRIRMSKSELAFGLQGGFLNYRINWSEADPLEANDIVIGQGRQNFLLPNVGAGIFYSTNRFYAGLSVPHILNEELINARPGLAEVSRLYRHYFLTAGYVFDIGNDIKMKPSFLMKYVPNTPFQADINLMFLLKDKYWFGASYRTNDAISLMVDFKVAKYFRIGYAFDYTLTPLMDYHSGSHEFVLGVEIFRKGFGLKSPRYF